MDSAKGLHIRRINENCVPCMRIFSINKRNGGIFSKCEGEIQREIGDKLFF